MTLFPAIIVFSLVFLSFSKEILAPKEEPKKKLEVDKSETSVADLLLKYKLLDELGEKP